MQPEILKDFSREGPLTLKVDGDCMQDQLPHGAEIRVEKHGFYWPGDVVVYVRGDGRLVSHRLLGYLPGRSGWRVVTQADHRRYADAPAVLSNVLGRVTQANGEAMPCSLRRRISSVLRYLPATARIVGQRLNTGGKIR